MRQVERYLDLLNGVFDGNQSHGPSLLQIVDGITDDQARRRPIPAAHSMFELVLHITSWMDVVARRLEGEAILSEDVEDFPNAASQSWPEAIERLKGTQSRLCDSVARCTDEKLEEKAVVRYVSNRAMLDMVINHAIYHSGQLALLKKGA